MKIIIVTGMPGAGKEEFLNVAVSMGLPFLRMGDIVREYHSEYGNGMSVGEYASSERKLHGMNIWAKRAIDKMSGDVFLVDGCRSNDEVEAYKELSDDIIVVAIHASPEVRYARLVKRGREDAPSNTEEFNDRDTREMSWGISNAIALADVCIDNSTTLEDFHARARKFLESL